MDDSMTIFLIIIMIVLLLFLIVRKKETFITNDQPSDFRRNIYVDKLIKRAELQKDIRQTEAYIKNTEDKLTTTKKLYNEHMCSTRSDIYDFNGIEDSKKINQLGIILKPQKIEGIPKDNVDIVNNIESQCESSIQGIDKSISCETFPYECIGGEGKNPLTFTGGETIQGSNGDMECLYSGCLNNCKDVTSNCFQHIKGAIVDTYKFEGCDFEIKNDCTVIYDDYMFDSNITNLCPNKTYYRIDSSSNGTNDIIQEHYKDKSIKRKPKPYGFECLYLHKEEHKGDILNFDTLDEIYSKCDSNIPDKMDCYTSNAQGFTFSKAFNKNLLNCSYTLNSNCYTFDDSNNSFCHYNTRYDKTTKECDEPKQCIQDYYTLLNESFLSSSDYQKTYKKHSIISPYIEQTSNIFACSNTPIPVNGFETVNDDCKHICDTLSNGEVELAGGDAISLGDNEFQCIIRNCPSDEVVLDNQNNTNALLNATRNQSEIDGLLTINNDAISTLNQEAVNLESNLQIIEEQQRQLDEQKKQLNVQLATMTENRALLQTNDTDIIERLNNIQQEIDLIEQRIITNTISQGSGGDNLEMRLELQEQIIDLQNNKIQIQNEELTDQTQSISVSHTAPSYLSSTNRHYYISTKTTGTNMEKLYMGKNMLGNSVRFSNDIRDREMFSFYKIQNTNNSYKLKNLSLNKWISEARIDDTITLEYSTEESDATTLEIISMEAPNTFILNINPWYNNTIGSAKIVSAKLVNDTSYLYIIDITTDLPQQVTTPTPIVTPVASPIVTPVVAPVATPVVAAPVVTPVVAPVSAAPIVTPVVAPVATPVVAAPVATPVAAAPVVAPPIVAPIVTPIVAPTDTPPQCIYDVVMDDIEEEEEDNSYTVSPNPPKFFDGYPKICIVSGTEVHLKLWPTKPGLVNWILVPGNFRTLTIEDLVVNLNTIESKDFGIIIIGNTNLEYSRKITGLDPKESYRLELIPRGTNLNDNDNYGVQLTATFTTPS
jgi:hypothetical protein